MENAEKVALPVFSDTEWTAEIDVLLLGSMDGDAAALGLIKSRCDRGFSRLLGVFVGSALVAAVVLATEGDEGVIVCAGGRWQGGGLVESMLPVIEAGFKAGGMKTARIETFRRGMMAKILRTGYRPT